MIVSDFDCVVNSSYEELGVRKDEEEAQLDGEAAIHEGTLRFGRKGSEIGIGYVGMKD
jgi:hypothetical protein